VTGRASRIPLDVEKTRWQLLKVITVKHPDAD